MNTKPDGYGESDLGNLLLQRRGISNTSLYIALIILSVLLISGVALFVSVKASFIDTTQLVVFLLLVFLIPITLKYRRTISVYERGVVLTTLFKKHCLLYKDLASVRFLIKKGTMGFVPNSVIFAFLPIFDNEVKFAISGSVRTVLEIAQTVQNVIQAYPDIQMHGDMLTVKVGVFKGTVEAEERVIVDKKIEF